MSDETEEGATMSAAESPRDKRTKLMSLGTEYRSSTPHQVAALTWAVVELAEATTSQVAVDEERNAILARQAQLAEAALAEQRTANIMAFYATNPNDYPAGVRDQIKAHLGIAVSPAAAIEETDVDLEPRSNVTQLPATSRRHTEEFD